MGIDHFLTQHLFWCAFVSGGGFGFASYFMTSTSGSSLQLVDQLSQLHLLRQTELTLPKWFRLAWPSHATSVECASGVLEGIFDVHDET